MDFEKLVRELCGDIWSGDHMDGLLRELNDIGHRFTGSPGERKAQKLVAAQLKKWSIRTRFQRFTADTWIGGDAGLRIRSQKIDIRCSRR